MRTDFRPVTDPMPDSLVGLGVWSAEIIFTAPGDFPQRILASVEVRAATIQAALAMAVKKGQTMGLDPEVVKIERTHPSWKERNA